MKYYPKAAGDGTDWLAALKRIYDDGKTAPDDPHAGRWPMTIKTGRRLPGEIDLGDAQSAIHEATEALRAGGFVIIEDDPEREGEGDLVLAAEFADAKKINFMMREACGILAVALTVERCEELMLPLLRVTNGNDDDPAFVLPCDLYGSGSGVSAAERAHTMNALADPTVKAGQRFRTPGHVFPLAARPGGVLERRGHTEASVDLCKIAQLQPAAVLCELLDAEGEPMCAAEVEVYARAHEIPIVSVEEIHQYRSARP